MKGRSTSWFDRGELKALFKGVKPPPPGEAAPERTEDEPGEERKAPAPPPPPLFQSPPPPPLSTADLPTDPALGATWAPPPEKEPAAPPPEAVEAAPAAPAVDEAAPAELVPPPPPEPPPAPAVAEGPDGGEPAGEKTLVPESTGASEPASTATAETSAPPPAPPPPAPLPVPGPPSATDPLSESLWRQSEALLHLARGQAATQALEERLWEITETAASVLSLARASVWTFEDEERTRLHCADLYSAVRDTHDSGLLQASRDYPLYFAALHSERPIVAHDAKADPRTRELAGGSLVPSQSRIEAPVLVAGRLAGVLRLEHEGSPRRFEHHEERFASSLADLSGLALEAQERRLKEAVARVGEERVRAQRDALAELSRGEALVRGRLEGVLQEVTEAAARVLRLERASVWVYAPDFKSLFCLDVYERSSGRHARGAEITEARAPRYFDALRAGGRLSLTDAREEPRLSELVGEGHLPPGISSRLEVPIHLIGRLAGVLWNERAGSPKAWLADEERFAEALAGFVALVIATSERRRSDHELRRALEDVGRGNAPKGEPEPSAAPAPAPPPPRPPEQAPDAFDEDLGDA